jgi:hypothetical protein
MKCDINTALSINLSLDVATFAVLQRALAFYAERAPQQAGDPAKELMWKFAGILKNLQRNGGIPEEPKPVPPLPPPTPLGETVSLGAVDAPDEWDADRSLPEEDEFEDPTLPRGEIDKEGNP